MVRSIGTRVIACLVLVSLLTTAGTVGLVLVRIGLDLQQGMAEHFALICDEGHHAVASTVARSYADLHVLAGNAVVASPTASAAEKHAELMRLKKILRVYEDITLLSPEGGIITSTDYTMRASAKHSSYFEKALRGESVMSAVHAVPDPFKVVVDFVGPVRGRDNSVAGLVVMRLNMDTVWQVLEGIRIGASGHALLLDEDRTIIGTPEPSAWLTLAPESVGDQILKGDSLLKFRNAAGTWVVGGWSKGRERQKAQTALPVADLNWVVVAVQNADEAYKPLRVLAVEVALVACVVLVLAVFLGVYYGRSITKPIAALASTAQALGQGEMNVAIPQKGDDEVAALAASFAAMRDSIRDKIQDLEESETRYRGLYQGMMDGFVRVGQDGKLAEFNLAFQRMLGYSEEELWGLTRSDVTPDKWRAFEERVLEEQTLKHGYSELYEKEYRRKDGTLFPVELRSYAIRDDQGDVSGMWAIVRDVSRRKEADKALAELQNLLQNVVDCMPSILVGVDPAGRITQWNRQAEEAFGIPYDAAMGNDLVEVQPRFASAVASAQEAIRSKETQTLLRVPHQEDGRTRYTDTTIYPLVGAGVAGAVIRVDDVTQRVQIEEMMVHSEKMLSVGGLAAGMAHEINNPLAGILQNAQVIRTRLVENNRKNRSAAEECGTSLPSIADYVERRGIMSMINSVIYSGRRASKVVSNMLTFSRRSDRGHGPQNLASLLDQAVDLARSDYDLGKKYDFRSVEVVREYEEDLPPVSCDGPMMQQVFLNLLRNCAQAMAGDNEGRTQRLVLRLVREGDQARVEIEDNGPGMEEAVRRRIFEPFFTTKEVGEGTGLGLSISYFIVTENHGGAMTVESSPGKGSTFIIRLPLRADS